MRFFCRYLKQRRRGLLFALLCAAIFSGTFLLYDVPLFAVLYPAGLCLVLGAPVLAADVRRARERHRRLEMLRRQPAALMEGFPQDGGQEAEDYQAVIAALRREQAQLKADMDRRYRDMVDYYTIWAHQIKTPIAAMRLILRNEDTAAGRQLTEELQRVERYVEMVMAFLRLGSDTHDYVFREQALDPIVREAVKKFAGQFIRKKLHLCYEPLPGRVLTDEKWLAFVVEQVLSNAVKYTEDGGTVTIALEPPMTLCIRDTGIGIAPEDLPRVFEKSYTGYNGRSDKKASGLGLYLCRRICDGLGHAIDLRSSPGGGTEVRIRLAHDELPVE